MSHLFEAQGDDKEEEEDNGNDIWWCLQHRCASIGSCHSWLSLGFVVDLSACQSICRPVSLGNIPAERQIPEQLLRVSLSSSTTFVD